MFVSTVSIIYIDIDCTLCAKYINRDIHAGREKNIKKGGIDGYSVREWKRETE